MCGIHCRVSAQNEVVLDSDAQTWLRRRGPDDFRSHQIKCGSKKQWHVSFVSSVLSLRGAQLQSQPVVDENTGSVLCWNGEAWRINRERVLQNDTVEIAQQLVELSRDDNGSVEQSLMKLLNSVDGPFAFVFFDAAQDQLYFGRDRLGRRSLLISRNADTDELTISSVDSATPQTSQEVTSNAVYTVDLSNPTLEIRILEQPKSFKINMTLPEERVTSSTPNDATISHIISHLQTSIDVRVQEVPTYTVFSQNHDPSRVAVLFSGGLDCTLLARLVHESLPASQPVDLLNVAFENPRVVNARKNNGETETLAETFELCPDRITGRSSFSELAHICPEREWRFVAINVPFQEFQEHKANIIRLMFPHNTEMDLSITSALYFASRGQGQLCSSRRITIPPQPYTTTARVLLSGLGADELFGGYARHAAAFARSGYEELNHELELDIMRIGHRNLGRDDRVIAHWGKETRYPFLDELFLSFSLGLPAWEKCGFRCDKPIPKHFEEAQQPETMADLLPDKMLLRCAAWTLSMKKAAAEKKRAIQFGARTAKMYAGRTKGTDKLE